MSKARDRIRAALTRHLAPVIERELHPERYHYDTGRRLCYPHQWRREGLDPLKPHERLTARLEIVCALKEYEHELLKEVLADTEAIEAAKAKVAEEKEHGAQVQSEGVGIVVADETDDR